MKNIDNKTGFEAIQKEMDKEIKDRVEQNKISEILRNGSLKQVQNLYRKILNPQRYDVRESSKLNYEFGGN